MKYYNLILLVCIITSCAPRHIYLDETGKEISIKKSTVFENREKWVYLDQNGDRITAEEFQQKWRNKENNLVRYDYIAIDTGRIATLKEPVYSRYIVSYSKVVDKFEEITGKTFPANTIFFINYTYRDDLCSQESSNNISKHKIASRKVFFKPRLDEIRSRNKEIVFLSFYENGIHLQNSPEKPEEYFYMDKENFLRENLFLTQTFCGSFALIKPNGQTLVRNGESSLWYIEQHLKPENWEQFFPPSE